MVIKLIISDIAGVFLSNADLSLLKYLAEAKGCSVLDVEKKILPWIYKSEKGEISEIEFIEGFLLDLGLELSAVEIQKKRHSLTVELEGIRDFIVKLKQKYKVAFVTNSNQFEFEHNNNEFGLLELFDYGVSSHQIGARKTEKKIFETVLEHFGFDFSEVVFFDDSKKNLVAAKDLGINVIHYQSVLQLRKDFDLLGVEF